MSSTALIGLLAAAASLAALLQLAIDDPKRRRSLRLATHGPRRPGVRRMLGAAALLPGIVLATTAQWTAWLIWLGLSLALGWVLVLVLARGVRDASATKKAPGKMPGA